MDRPLESRDVGTHNHIGHVFQGIPQAWERGAPTLGQDNEYVFKEVLGLDDTAYDRLVTDASLSRTTSTRTATHTEF